MSLWQRLKARIGQARNSEPPRTEPAPPEASEPGGARAPSGGAELPAPPDDIDRLAAFGAAGGPSESEALAALARARGSLDESRTIARLLAAGERLTSALRVALAQVLSLRGEDDRALELLSGVRSGDGLLLCADLFAGRGDYPSAIGAIERVLARDLAAPGALERHARWQSMAFAAVRPARHLDEPTLLAPEPEGTSFRIAREVARGGAGTVYEAMDDVLLRKVAFKVHHRGGQDSTLIEHEVRLAARFAGPGVVRVFDASPEAGWVAFEWVGQGSLRDWIRAGRTSELFPIRRWAVPLARALARVHDAGYVHADLKPANVLLRSAEEPILTDFGLARPVASALVGGSVGYMSPERLGGKPASFAEDVYGFGRVLEDVLEVAAGQPEAASRELGALVTRCLGPAAARPESARMLLEALQRAS